MKSVNSNNTVLTLDAGGTNFIFSAVNESGILETSIQLPASTSNQDACTQTIIEGFESLVNQISFPIVAISFAFPGPSDYENGIIGNLPNFSGLNGNYPLKMLLEKHFKIPVYINNDGDLFAYGEAISGALPWINLQLEKNNSIKRFSNLIGITLGTGVGCGLVFGKNMLKGDNSCAAEIHNLSNPTRFDWNMEESVSTRAIKRVYFEKSGEEINKALMPEDIYHIATGKRNGIKKAALESYQEYGKALGQAIQNMVTLIDGLVVIGGGITGAWDLFAPSLFNSLNQQNIDLKGSKYNKTSFKIFNLEDEIEMNTFLKGKKTQIQLSENEHLEYDSMQRSGIMLSKFNASQSIFIGAYEFAASKLDLRK